MKKKIIILVIFTILIAINFSGCTNPFDESSKFVGTGSTGSTYSTVTFFSDGTCDMSGTGGTWEIKDGKFTIDGLGMSGTFDYSFANNDNILTLTHVSTGQATVFTKK